MLTGWEVSGSPPVYGSCSLYRVLLWLSLTLGILLEKQEFCSYLQPQPDRHRTARGSLNACQVDFDLLEQDVMVIFFACLRETLLSTWQFQKGLTEQGRYTLNVDNIILWNESLDWEELRGSECEHPVCFLAVEMTAASHSDHREELSATSQSQLPRSSYDQGRISADVDRPQLED